VESYKVIIDNPNITFDSRQSSDQSPTTILEDFFSMSKFDCLIRPRSAFSICAQLIGDHKIVLFPKNYKWQNNKLIITDTWMISK